jgi:hypothetical protein
MVKMALELCFAAQTGQEKEQQEEEKSPVDRDIAVRRIIAVRRSPISQSSSAGVWSLGCHCRSLLS